ncbi:MAG: ornithine carbamoyltransferase [Nitrospinota bacterium]|nr:MAG: ornithine carbamoyltransferase [Nitrospinota bacterium]
MKRDLLTLDDLSVDEIEQILARAALRKKELRAGIPHPVLQGKTLGMIFKKPSSRTRVSFEVGMYQLGGYAVVLSHQDIRMGQRESVPDIGRLFSRYLHGIMVRTFAHEEAEELAQYATIPVINGLTDLTHPCQILAAIFTIQEQLGRYRGVKVAYVGDGNNVAHSWLKGASKLGIHLTIASPPQYQPRADIVKKALEVAEQSGSQIEIITDPRVAVKGADIIYTDVWASMGQEAELETRRQVFAPYQVNQDLLQAAKPETLVMHCLPAHRGEEITAEVIDGERSIVFEEAENRLHVQKAILEFLLRPEGFAA